MIDIQTETLITLREAAGKLPGRPRYETVWRWCTRGYKGVVLDSTSFGRTLCTSMEALERFSDQLSGKRPATVKRQPAKRRVGKMEDKLKKIGVL